MLTLTGLLGSAALLALTDQAKRWPLNTAAQLVAVTVALLRLGPRGVDKAVEHAQELPSPHLGTGEPTPLWHIPVPVLAAALFFKGAERLPGPGASRAGWDASLRVTLGAALVGLAQAGVLERSVATAERRTGRTYYRAKGARLGRGTPLAYPATAHPST